MKGLLSGVVCTLVIVCALGLFTTPVQAQFNIAFDGFCDGMFIQYGAGVKHGGNQTGCVVKSIWGNYSYNFLDDPFAVAAVGQATSVVQFGGNDTYMLDFATLRWVLYRSVAGSVPTVLASGTFSFGIPAASAGPATGN